MVEERADPTSVGGRVETSGATVGVLGWVGSLPDSNRGLEAGSEVGGGGSEQPSSPHFPPGTVGERVVREVVGVVVVVVGGTTVASPFSSWETSVEVSVGGGGVSPPWTRAG